MRRSYVRRMPTTSDERIGILEVFFDAALRKLGRRAEFDHIFVRGIGVITHGTLHVARAGTTRLRAQEPCALARL